MNPDVLAHLLPMALRAAGAPPAVVTLVEQLGPAVAPILGDLLRRHEAGEPLEVLRAQMPDVARVVREAEGE